MSRSLLSICFLFCLFTATAQNKDSDPQASKTHITPKYIQFSGIVLTHDSLKVVSYASISIARSNKRTSADGDGFFNFVARTGDSIIFSAIGYKTAFTVIPKDLNSDKYSWIQLMREDTVMLGPAVIRAWPTKDEIDRFIATGNVSDYDQALENTDKQKLARMEKTLPKDGLESQKAMLNYQAAKYYYYGQTPPLRVLDPIAWASFFKSWKAGKFKQK